MKLTPIQFYRGGIPGSAAPIIYTCPANTIAVVKHAFLRNSSSADRTFLVRVGASFWLPNLLIEGGQILTFDTYQVLTATETIVITTSGGDSASVSLSLAGLVFA